VNLQTFTLKKEGSEKITNYMSRNSHC